MRTFTINLLNSGNRMKLVRPVLLCFIFIVMLISCKQEQGNLTSVYQENEYIFGVWKAPSAKIAKESIGIVSANIQASSSSENIQDKKAQPQIETEQENNKFQPTPEQDSSFNTLPYKTIAAPETLLPDDGETTDWVRSRKLSTYTPQNIYLDRFVPSEIYPEIYRKYGFKRQAEVEYQSPKFGSNPLILLEIFDMGTPENAYGVYSVNSYPLPKFEWVGCKAIISGKYIWFWKGKYFIQIEGYEIAPGIREGMVDLAKVVAKKIKDPPQKIPLLELLPRYIDGSEKLFTTNWVLEQVHKTLPNLVPMMEDGTVGVLARTHNLLKKSGNPYTVFVFRYSTIADAQSAYITYQNDLTSENVSFKKDPQNGAILIDEIPAEQQ